MVSKAILFAEGGGSGPDSKNLSIQCREGFKKLLVKSGLKESSFKVRARGSRKKAYDDFVTAHNQKQIPYIALLVDSEDPIVDIEKTWDHLKARPGDEWPRPDGATDEQVLLMATCMETWIVADQEGLKRYFEAYKPCVRYKSLPSTVNLEARDRHTVQDALTIATKDCGNYYAKNKRSFEALANINPKVLESLPLPSFVRILRILRRKLR